jgi:hypothetical protein
MSTISISASQEIAVIIVRTYQISLQFEIQFYFFLYDTVHILLPFILEYKVGRP